VPSAFERTLKLLPELTAAEVALLLELKTATSQLAVAAMDTRRT
jgi:hypothetical protein